MKIYIASDHRGIELKKYIIKKLNKIDIEDLGSFTKESVDYPDFAFKLGKKVVDEDTFGIAICGSGIGISIACNKVKKVRCAKVNTIKDAIITRKDNDSNIVALSASINKDKAIRIIEEFINTPFSNEERHIKRINKINEYELKN